MILLIMRGGINDRIKISTTKGLGHCHLVLTSMNCLRKLRGHSGNAIGLKMSARQQQKTPKAENRRTKKTNDLICFHFSTHAAVIN